MRKHILLAVCTLLLIFSLSYYNATKINTKQITTIQQTLSSDKIDKDVDGLLIAFFSDLYYGSFIDKDYIDMAIDKINRYQPDLLIFGGDLIYQHYTQISQDDIDYLIEKLKSLNSSLGKYAVFGEQDYLKKEMVEDILKQADFEIITNTNRKINTDKNSYINLIGIDSLIGGTPDIASAFNGINDNTYTIVVSHCPDLFAEIETQQFDYMLSGHSFGGQINIPIINLFTRNEGCKKYYSGKITKNNKTLDICNGLGRINSDARFLADAQIKLYTLKSVNNAE